MVVSTSVCRFHRLFQRIMLLTVVGFTTRLATPACVETALRSSGGQFKFEPIQLHSISDRLLIVHLRILARTAVGPNVSRAGSDNRECAKLTGPKQARWFTARKSWASA